jgi:hypothetical protein
MHALNNVDRPLAALDGPSRFVGMFPKRLRGNSVITFRKSKLTREYLAGLGLNARQFAAVKHLKAH